MKNPFFKNKGPFKINKLLKLSGIKNLNTFEKDMIKNVNDLNNAKNNEIECMKRTAFSVFLAMKYLIQGMKNTFKIFI